VGFCLRLLLLPPVFTKIILYLVDQYYFQLNISVIGWPARLFSSVMAYGSNPTGVQLLLNLRNDSDSRSPPVLKYFIICCALPS
jgi:hypothetical protein